MTKNELDKIKAKHLDEIKFRKNEDSAVTYKYEVMVCESTSCHSNKSKQVREQLLKSVKNNHLTKQVRVNSTGCFGLCAKGPIVIVYPEGIFYTKVKVEDVEEIVIKHLMGGEVVERLLITVDGKPEITKNDIPFYNKQKFIARAGSEYINPEQIEDYIALDGFCALNKVLTSMSPEDVISEITLSGLRGRGGAGFPTGKKWEFGRASKGDTKYVICNADEGDPGAFMDRSILESNPFAIVEAMTIAGYAIGANKGYIYVRAEYPLAGQRLVIAIDESVKAGLLGKNIMNSGFDFDLEIKYGAGAFVCGEETALLNSIEGKRGEPRFKPPYPAVKGLFGCPTVINNVETYANIPSIIRNGSNWYKSIGIDNNAGTKVFALTGKINNSGLIELPMGSTIRTIIEDIGGGIPNGKKFKAVQMGGPSGGCIPSEYIDTPIAYENLTKLGSMMGSGGMIVMDEDTCMVDIAKFFLEFTCDESCGKCTPCRIGNKRILEILNKITEGKAELKDLDKLEELCKYVKENSLCGLGQSSPNPVLSTLRYFRDEYIEHITEHKCRAGVCKSMTKFTITDKCKGCSMCARNCPMQAITGEVGKQFVIDQSKCIKCGLCKNNCKFGAISKG